MGNTIVALASAAGAAGVAVVRISGSGVADIIQRLGLILKPRLAKYAQLLTADNQVIDQGIWLYFPAPNSFTGEDVLEFHGHGNAWLVDAVIKRFCQLGCRLAEPGEFSKRAFLNGKLDLVQAEAIADLVNASSNVAARMAMASLQGGFSKEINVLLAMVINARVQLEAAVDFPDEDFEPAALIEMEQSFLQVENQISKVMQQAERGAVVQSGINVVLAGPPNVGKSSLFNSLLGHEAAIVTSEAGTTRDVISTECRIGAATITLQDTAGVHISSNMIEQEGIKRAKSRLEQADIVLLMLDHHYADIGHARFLQDNHLQVSGEIVPIWNKLDICPMEAVAGVKVSVKKQLGLEDLFSVLQVKIEAFAGSDGHAFSARFRHVEALREALQAIRAAVIAIKSHDWELAAEDCRHVQKHLSSITGEFTNEDLLGRIFSTFCIGK